ncbi:MAG TPA: chloride channel protein [Phycisphaerae bacterium]|jgi:CIC family chloride channel protein|nr:chloride channel protein [Phycisphaerae bacterium]
MDIGLVKRVAKMPAMWRLRVLQALARWGVREETLLMVLSAVIGLAAGGAVWLFERTLHFVETEYFLRLTQATHATTSNLWLLPLLPAAGGLALIGIRWIFRVEHSRLHGISAILYALIRKAGTLRRTMGLETLLASSLTIGTGGSAGPEAPIAVIGSSVGSLVSRAAGISRRNVPTLIGCGAAAGISAIFSAPIAGVLFAMEVMLRDFSVRTFTPIVISSVIATVTYQTITGEIGRGLFATPADLSYHFTFGEMPYYLLLGILCGVLAVTFTRVLGLVERLFARQEKRLHRHFHPALGALLSGVCGVILILLFRHDPYLGGPAGQFAAKSYVPIFSTGYPTIHRALDPQWYIGHLQPSGEMALLSLAFLAAVCVLKLLATSLTLGSGGSGGVFAPALFIGATGGGAVGLLLQHFNPAIEPSSYAIVGMGAVLAAAIQAPLMAIMLLFELTRNYQIMLPAMLAAVTATVIQQVIVRDGLYTLPLRAQGIRVGSAVGVSQLRRIGIDQIPLKKARTASANDSVTDLIARARLEEEDFVIFDAKGHYLGLLPLRDVRTIMLAPESIPLLLTGEILRTDVPPLTLADTLETAFESFTRFEVDSLPVFSTAPGTAETLLGVVLRGDLMRQYHVELSSQ